MLVDGDVLVGGEVENRAVLRQQLLNLESDQVLSWLYLEMIGHFIGVASEVVRKHVFILGVGGVEEVSFLILEYVFLQALSVGHAALKVHPVQRPANAYFARRRNAGLVL